MKNINIYFQAKAEYIKFILPYCLIKRGVSGIVITFDIAKQEKVKPITNSDTPFCIAFDEKRGAINE